MFDTRSSTRNDSNCCQVAPAITKRSPSMQTSGVNRHKQFCEPGNEGVALHCSWLNFSQEARGPPLSPWQASVTPLAVVPDAQSIAPVMVRLSFAYCILPQRRRGHYTLGCAFNTFCPAAKVIRRCYFFNFALVAVNFSRLVFGQISPLCSFLPLAHFCKFFILQLFTLILAIWYSYFCPLFTLKIKYRIFWYFSFLVPPLICLHHGTANLIIACCTGKQAGTLVLQSSTEY